MPRLTDRTLDELLLSAKRALLDRVRARLTATPTAKTLFKRAVLLDQKLQAHARRGQPLEEEKASLIKRAEAAGFDLTFQPDGVKLLVEGEGGYYNREYAWPAAGCPEKDQYEAARRKVQTVRAGGDRAQLQAALEELHALVDGAPRR